MARVLVVRWRVPGTATLGRLFVTHVFIVPLLIFGLLGAHLAIIWRQKHTQFPGPGKTEKNVVGSPLWPTYAAKSLAMGAFVAAMCALLGGLVQINPVWLYGPYHPRRSAPTRNPTTTSAGSKARSDSRRRGSCTSAASRSPKCSGPASCCRRSSSACCTCGRSSNASSRATARRTTCSTGPATDRCAPPSASASLTFFIVLTVAGGQDVVAQKTHASITSVTLALRILLVALPIAIAVITWKWCHDLQAGDARAAREPPPAPAAPERVGARRD